ncbi:YAK1 [Candida jiufengensis]|uniref:YAK1 n=1 Tax=Candida jiufengensis TaxID=497108 RepID=UPI00222586CF|nr:YAK1 [Candida jiufengensis]KAI5955913.1 YAK1 [Candida jiufengensis]
MAYNNYNYRHNSIGGNWHLPPPPQQQQQGQNQQGQPINNNNNNNNDMLTPEQIYLQHQQQIYKQLPNQQQQQQQAPGFRNPWFSINPPTNSKTTSPSSGISQSPTKSQTLPILQQHQPPSLNKRLSFTNYLPVTYENENTNNFNDPNGQNNNNNSSSSSLTNNHSNNNNNNNNNPQLSPYVHPPTRADNPFNQYFANQEVSLGGGSDRRMSAAIDGTYYSNNNQTNNNLYGYNHQQQQQALINKGLPIQGDLSSTGVAMANKHGIAPAISQFFNPNMAPMTPSMANRRSSLAVLPSHALQQQQQLQQPGAYYAQPKTGRSPSIIQYQQYQQALQNQKITKTRKPAPKARKIYNKLDLSPKIHQQPKYRRCSVNSIHISPVNALSVYLTESYSICQPRKFQYSKSTNPKRVLTKPSDPKFNNGFDNEESDYILYVNDILGSEEGRKYMVLDLLGSGTFGQVVKCQNLTNQTVCAVKVIKSKPAYMNQSLTEVRLLEYLNKNSDGKNFIRLLDTFMHKEHLCLVFELLASNLYELIKQNQFQGLNMKLVKLLTKQLLEALVELKNFQMIHCDLKPENILLCQPDKPNIKVIDFGSACFTRQTIYTYIQSRFYRSPEVILGLPYTESIDMWSLGCIVGEFFLGLPMFPGTSEYNQIWKIVDMLGQPPRHMIEVGRNSSNFFKKSISTNPEDKPKYHIKSYDEYCEFIDSKKDSSGNNSTSNSNSSHHHHTKKEQPNKNYFKHKLLKDIILNYKLPSKKMTNLMIEKECQERLLLIDFLTKVLNLNPLERLTPQEALKHPFIHDVKSIDIPT